MTHECIDCKWCHSFEDSSGRTIEICVFDQSISYLEEVGCCCECELEGYAEELYQRSLE